jgi:serine/threonine-protein kinase
MEAGTPTGGVGATASSNVPVPPSDQAGDKTERVSRATALGTPGFALAVTPGPAPVLVKEVGGFELLTRLGEGGMGQVFKARQKSLDRVVALKVLTPRLAESTDYVKRFEHEARLAARLNHPSIVQVIEQGQDGLVRFIAFEFVDGPSLEHVLRERKKLTELEALEIARDMADALAYANEHGLVHRDVKPENILLTAKGVPKLADLGLAKMQGEHSTTQTGIVMGTPHYMAPEHALGDRDLDSRADLYSLGVVLYRCVTGQYPWLAETPLQLLTRNINEDIPDPRSVASDVSSNVATLIRGLTMRDRALRYPSPVAAFNEIESILNSGPALGPAPYIEAAKAAKGETQSTDASSARRSSSRRRAASGAYAAAPKPLDDSRPTRAPQRTVGRSATIGFLGIALGAAASFAYVAFYEKPGETPSPSPSSPQVVLESPSPAPSPTPEATPQATPTPEASPTPAPTPTPSPSPRPSPTPSPAGPPAWEKLPIEQWPENARVFDGHRWRRTEKGHVHGPKCGHWKRDKRWNIFSSDPREVDYYLTSEQKADEASGVYEVDGKLWYLPGHTHDSSCIHVKKDGRWILPP